MSFFYRVLRILAIIFIKPFYPVKVIGRENLKRGKGILVCNHFRMLDIVLLGLIAKEQLYFVGKKELYKNRFIRWFFLKMKSIPIDREGNDVKAMMSIIRTLKEDKKVAIFPEGTRNKTGENLSGVKAGSAVFAIKAKAPVYPVMMLRRSRFLRKNYIICGESYEYFQFYDKKLKSEDIDEAGDMLKNKLLALHEEVKSAAEKKGKR